MSENDSYLSLAELNGFIKEILLGNFIEDVWVVAEISDVNMASSGHCYMELVEKRNEKVVARMKANVWSFQYQKIALDFLSSTGSQLAKGMKILIQASVSFHELYGISLVVKNIDSSFTIGELAKNKKEIISRLKKEGLIGLNKEVPLELVPKRIAIISSATAAGYEDFVNQLTNNKSSYVFETTLFSSVMQGERVENELLSALVAVMERIKEFDVVVLIRGGGASLDLTAFDSYHVAAQIAKFPLPVFVGLGHDRDSTVLDLVAHTSLKTPTAVASFIITQFEDFEGYIKELSESLVHVVKDKLFKAKHKTTGYRSNFAYLCQTYLAAKKEEKVNLSSKLNHSCDHMVFKEKQRLSLQKNKLGSQYKYSFSKERQNIAGITSRLLSSSRVFLNKNKALVESQQRTVKILDPENILKRGYAIVMNEKNEFIKSKKQTKVDEELSIVLKDGHIKVKIKKYDENQEL